MSTTMRAAVYDRNGPARDVLRVVEVQRPSPAAGEVLVRMVVAAVNPTDVKTRRGLTPRPMTSAQIPGMDGAGIIEAVGVGVDPSRVGEHVWLWLAAHGRPTGTAAEFCVVPSDHAVSLPADASFDLGATLGVPALTAADCLLGDGPVNGKDVLVTGGAGAVGRYAIQLARWAGARVCATVSGHEKERIARDAGAHATVNYREPDAAARVREWSTDIDRIVDVAIGTNIGLDLEVSRPGTTIVAYAVDGPPAVEIPIRAAMTSGISVRFMLLYTVSPAALASAVDATSRALAAGALTMPPAVRFALDDIASAHEAQEAGPLGKVLVDVWPG